MSKNSLPTVKSKEYKKLVESNKKAFDFVLGDLISFSGYEQPSYVKGDSHETAFNEGMKRVVKRIINFINFDEEKLEQSKKIFRTQVLEHINKNK